MDVYFSGQEAGKGTDVLIKVNITPLRLDSFFRKTGRENVTIIHPERNVVVDEGNESTSVFVRVVGPDISIVSELYERRVHSKIGL